MKNGIPNISYEETDPEMEVNVGQGNIIAFNSNGEGGEPQIERCLDRSRTMCAICKITKCPSRISTERV